MRLPTDWIREEIQQDLSEDDLIQEIKRRIQLANQKVIDNIQRKKENSKIQYDLKAREKRFNVGDKILLHQPLVRWGRSKKLVKPWVGPYTVVEVNSDVNITIKRWKHLQKVHLNRVKPFREKFTKENSFPENEDTMRYPATMVHTTTGMQLSLIHIS